ncbi:MAG TPA: M6 family metalloprotease domain-containing protein, partial [Longimicrobiales bacterium]
IPEFYDEISGGRITLGGETHDWERSTLTEADVAAGRSGLGGSKVGVFILEILKATDDGSVDWGRYDNDGPDGLPNSGDDDGFVDVLAVFQPSRGAECGGSGNANRIWSHKWVLRSAAGMTYATTTDAANGGKIRVDDYTIQPVVSCDFQGGQTQINEIGVLAHELGHGFGLPDLYCTASGCNHAGIGRWGLMGSGNWGCWGGEPWRPCHMEAWSKAMLGWVDVETLAPGVDHGVIVLEPVEEGGSVLRIDAGDGSNEYFLIENRQRIGFDAGMSRPGLLIWHIDQDIVDARWPANTINNTAGHMGVWLRQADGLDQLAQNGGSRADDGDPFPGFTGNTRFSAGSNPGAFTHLDAASGLTVMDIQEIGQNVSARILTRFQTVTVQMIGDGGGGQLTVDGLGAPAGGVAFESAPFQRHVISVTGGSPIADGVRLGFQGWNDDPEATREREFVTPVEDVQLTAVFGGEEVRLRVDVDGEDFGVPQGTVASLPAGLLEEDGSWFLAGTSLSLQANPITGYGFQEWLGPVAGQGNPALLTLDEPADVTAVFALTYSVPEELAVELVAARPAEVYLVAENANLPVKWFLDQGALPQGLALDDDGRLVGAPIETGTFAVVLRARDSYGLTALGSVVVDVSAPTISLRDLTGPLLGQPHGLAQLQRDYLDFDGNRNGVYDLGDFRAFILAYPDAPETAQEMAPVQVRVPVVRFRAGGER